MPIVKIHVSSKVESTTREAVINDIRKAIVEILEVGYNHAFVILYDTSQPMQEVNDRINNHCIFVEIYMFSGRTDEVKEKFFHELSKIIKLHIAVEGKEVFFNIIDSDRNNWAGKDGVPFSEVKRE